MDTSLKSLELPSGRRALLRTMARAGVSLAVLGASGVATFGQTGSGAGVLPAADSGVLLPDFPFQALADPFWAGLEEGPLVQIASVVDGDTVELESGPDVRLVGTQAPKLPLGRAHVAEWPLAQASKAMLERLVEAGGREARLYFGGRRTDRHGRHLAHAVLGQQGATPLWLQGEMVLAGMTRVYTFADNRSLIGDLLAREELSRRSGRGVWADPYYQVRDASDVAGLSQLSAHFELVGGTVVNVAAQRALWYLNFGQSWREDFTVTVDRDQDRLFEESGFDLNALQGAAVRVRGWISQNGGPMMRIDHPEAIEVLTPLSR